MPAPDASTGNAHPRPAAMQLCSRDCEQSARTGAAAGLPAIATRPSRPAARPPPPAWSRRTWAWCLLRQSGADRQLGGSTTLAAEGGERPGLLPAVPRFVGTVHRPASTPPSQPTGRTGLAPWRSRTTTWCVPLGAVPTSASANSPGVPVSRGRRSGALRPEERSRRCGCSAGCSPRPAVSCDWSARPTASHHHWCTTARCAMRQSGAIPRTWTSGCRWRGATTCGRLRRCERRRPSGAAGSSVTASAWPVMSTRGCTRRPRSSTACSWRQRLPGRADCPAGQPPRCWRYPVAPGIWTRAPPSAESAPEP